MPLPTNLANTALANVAPADARHRRDRRPGRALGRRLAVVGLLAALTVPASAGAVSGCAPGPGDVLEHRALLAGDGTLESASSWVVGTGSEPCRSPRVTDARDLGVAVAISHRDGDGSALEPAQLSRTEGSVTTRVRVVDATATEVLLVADGPDGAVRDERRIGAPMTVRIELTYPGSWAPDVSPDVTVRRDGRRTIVSSTLVVAVPFTPDEGVLEVTAEPGRGIPEVTVAVATLPGEVLSALRDRDADRETYAVLGALLEVSADGTVALADGAGELADGLDALADGTRELADGTRELATGTRELADGVDELVVGVAALAAGTGGLAEGTDAYVEGVAGIALGLDGTATGAAGLADGLGALVAGLESALGPDAGRDALAAAAVALAEGLAQLAAGAGALADGGQPLAEGSAGVDDGVGELLEGVRALAEATRALAEGTEALAEGTEELADGAREAADGARELEDGARELPDALLELLGIADRRAAALALEDAAVVRASTLALERARGGDGAVAILTTTAEGAEVPVVALGAAGGASAVLLPLVALAWWRRRRVAA